MYDKFKQGIYSSGAKKWVPQSSSLPITKFEKSYKARSLKACTLHLFLFIQPECARIEICNIAKIVK